KGYFAAGSPDTPSTHLRTQVLASAMVAALRAVLHAAIETGDDIATLAGAAFGMLEAGLPTAPKLPRHRSMLIRARMWPRISARDSTPAYTLNDRSRAGLVPTAPQGVVTREL